MVIFSDSKLFTDMLTELGFTDVFDSIEYAGGTIGCHGVKQQEPFLWGWNNRVLAVTDENGRPWINEVNSADKRKLIEKLHEVQPLALGARVPHSNDSGHFVSEWLPKYRKDPEAASAAQWASMSAEHRKRMVNFAEGRGWRKIQAGAHRLDLMEIRGSSLDLSSYDHQTGDSAEEKDSDAKASSSFYWKMKNYPVTTRREVAACVHEGSSRFAPHMDDFESVADAWHLRAFGLYGPRPSLEDGASVSVYGFATVGFAEMMAELKCTRSGDTISRTLRWFDGPCPKGAEFLIVI